MVDFFLQVTDYVQVPSDKCGLIIGKGGETIKNINASCGVHCEVDKNAPPDARDKNFVIKGPAEGVERAKNMILEKLGGGGYGGGGGQSWGGGGHGGYDQVWSLNSDLFQCQKAFSTFTHQFSVILAEPWDPRLPKVLRPRQKKCWNEFK